MEPHRMDDMLTYQIELQGQVDEGELNAISPLQVAVIELNRASTKFTTNTDQSGLIGLLRHLNGRGFVLLSLHSSNPST